MKELIITRIICVFFASILLIFCDNLICQYVALILEGISFAVFYDLIESTINHYNKTTNNFVSLIPVRINIAVFWCLPFFFLWAIPYLPQAMLVTLSVIMLIVGIFSMIMAFLFLRRINISFTWALFIYIPVIRLFVLYKVLKAMDEKIKKAQLN